ncbi:unnamed protein product [Orchesella dallaii]|uniref:Ig-like domain-containing protein n=1 Tax=Orchesella dallaii TaxID=48710 RepID=A0ABP1PX20_9HEXA
MDIDMGPQILNLMTEERLANPNVYIDEERRRSCFNHKCKHRSSVVDTNDLSIKTVNRDHHPSQTHNLLASTSCQQFGARLYREHNKLCCEAPTKKMGERESCSSARTSCLLSGSSGGSSKGRLSRRKFNVFHKSPLLLLLFVGLAGVTGVRINSLTVPQTIRNGTEDSVILDCDYSVDEAEKKGLVVKWFHERKQSPVYQWIPNKKPIDLGILRGKLNLDFEADADEFKLHRALQIIRPTIELSGNWICEVSTFEGEAFKAGRMIIFAPEKDMGIRVSENRREGRVNVSCWATNVYPEPRLILFRDDQMVDDLVVTTKLNRGAYDVSAYKVIEDANLSSLASMYECELTIPNTNYVRRETKLYEPGSLELRDELTMGSGGVMTPNEFLSMSLFYLWLLVLFLVTFSMNSAATLFQDAAPGPLLSVLTFCL